MVQKVLERCMVRNAVDDGIKAHEVNFKFPRWEKYQ